MMDSVPVGAMVVTVALRRGTPSLKMLSSNSGKAPRTVASSALALRPVLVINSIATQYAFIDGRLHEAEQAMLKFMLEFLAQYGRVSLGLTEEEELDDNNFPVTTTLYGKHDTPRIKLTDVYLTDDAEYLLADGIDAETGEKRDGFYIYSEQYADIFQFVGHASEMN